MVVRIILHCPAICIIHCPYYPTYHYYPYYPESSSTAPDPVDLLSFDFSFNPLSFRSFVRI